MHGDHEGKGGYQEYVHFSVPTKGLTQREMPDMVFLLKVLMALGEAEGS